MAVAIKRPERERPPTTEHFDVLILGAGLSGIGAACHLRRAFPGKALAILEAREAIGGTWDLFRYPGIRSDSDMFTMGYSFRPWEDARGIADGPSILNYIRDTAKAHGIEELIRFGHRAVSAAWSSEDARWTVLAERADGEHVTVAVGAGDAGRGVLVAQAGGAEAGVAGVAGVGEGDGGHARGVGAVHGGGE